MAIRFVDKTPEGDGPDGTKPARAPRTRPEAAPPVPDTAVEDEAAVEAPPPRLTHAKPEPKQRGRKVSMAQAMAAHAKPAEAKPAEAKSAEAKSAEAKSAEAKPADVAAAEGADGLFPGLQLHAKPTPKPRGRKKAFG